MVKYVYENEQNQAPADLAETIERLKEDMRIVRERNLRTLAHFKTYRMHAQAEGNTFIGESTHAIPDPAAEISDGMANMFVWVGNEPHPVVSTRR